MPRSAVFYLSLVPLLPILVYLVLPAQYREPYAYWSSAALNTAGQGGHSGDGSSESRVKTWRNMGYWKGTDDYSIAAEALGAELLRFASARSGGRVMDIGHGSGESLLLHLNTTHPPTHLHALTSLSSESRQAQTLVTSYLTSLPPTSPQHGAWIEFFTGSAVPRGASDHEHPLHHMRGFMGDASAGAHSGAAILYDDEDDDDDEEAVREQAFTRAQDPESSSAKSAPPYDLIYALDAAYHFPPSLASFQAAAYRHLAPGGVLTYTDVVPPSSLSSRPFLSRAISTFMNVPMPNLIRGYDAEGAEGVEKDLRDRGYECVRTEDWSEHVWPGFAMNLETKGGMWAMVSKGVKGAENGGWRVVAVKIAKPDEAGRCPLSFGA